MQSLLSSGHIDLRRAAGRLLAVCVLWLTASGPLAAAEALVAVAANFRAVLDELQSGFEAATEHRLRISAGSTGKLYAQILRGAPFDVFLAADQARPEALLAAGEAVPGSRFTYALGRLTLWSTDPALVVGDGAQVLSQCSCRHLAIANPRLAPYGAAARQTLEALGLWQGLQDRIIMGQNIGQTHALVATGNAELGLVALSYVLSPRNHRPGSRWDVPTDLHDPIRQDAVLTRHGAGNPAARAFLEYLRGDAARAHIARSGYRLE